MQISMMLLQFVYGLQLVFLDKNNNIMVQSQANDEAFMVSVPIRHSLPTFRTESLFNSSMNGNCSSLASNSSGSVIHRGAICNGTSVLNDGIIPALSNVSNETSSLWAAQLLTMNQSSIERIVLSFEVENQVYDCMELAVFNCPERSMNASRINIYSDTSFRPERKNDSFGTNKASYFLSNTSCDYLVKFYVSFMPVNSSYFNIEFPALASENHVFLGEVSFLSGAGDCEQCPPELIMETIYRQHSTGFGNSTDVLACRSEGTTKADNQTLPSSTSSTDQQSQSTLIAVVATVIATLALLVVVLLVLVMAFVFLRNRKREKLPLGADNLGYPEDSMTQTSKESETKISNFGVHKTTSVNSEHLKESVSASSIPVPESDGIYSTPDEVENVVSTSFTNSNQAASQQYYVKQNASYHTRHSPAPVSNQEVDDLAGDGVTYAVPNKEKRKTRQSSPSNLLSRAEFEASTEALLQSTADHDNDNTLYESIDSAPGPPLPSSRLENSIISAPDRHPTDTSTDQPIATTSDIQQHSHSGEEEGMLDDDNAIYAEPLDSSSKVENKMELGQDPDIYESIYSEPLKPSLFMQETPTDLECQDEEAVESEDLYPYSSIYTIPDTDLTNKPLLVSVQNIKIMSRLGNGNFGEVVLAQTVDLTPQQLQIESQAPFALVAVKRLRASASEETKELFDKEVKFMSRLNHPNVVRMLGVCRDEENPFIMMEYMMNGDLHQYLKEFSQIGEGEYINVRSISVSTLTNISLQIASAMQYLASHNFVHRDLATRNCLVGSKNTVKIADFGMSRSLYESHYYIISGHAILPVRWMATECFYGRFSAKTDIWAFGITVWEIFTLAKEQPYEHLQDMEVVEDAIKGPNRTLLERPPECPKEVYDVMKACWAHDPAQRSTFDQLYEMLSVAKDGLSSTL